MLDRHTSDFCGNDLVAGATSAGQGRIGVVGDFVWHGDANGLKRSKRKKEGPEGPNWRVVGSGQLTRPAARLDGCMG